MDLFNGMDILLKTYWFIAIPVSIIFMIQTVMTFMGTDSTDGLSADFDGDFSADTPFQLFSLRNLINFLLGFSWAGISFYSTLSNKGLLIGVSVVIGALFLILFFLIIRQLQRLAEDNSFKIEETLDKTAEVYLKIPAQKTGLGKVIISVRGSVRELNALTEGDTIPSGSLIKVVKIESGNLLIVERI
jgi:hypothetical protein